MATEVFNRIGEAEMHSETSSNFYKRQRIEEENDDLFEKSEKIESTSKPIVDAKKEFFESLEDDSLTIDICNNVNHDWKNS